MKIEPNMRERALFLFSPKKANEKYAARVKAEQGKAKEQTRRATMAASGYGLHGASQTLNSMIGWITGGGGAEDDIDVHGSLLRVRARDLYAGGGLGRSGTATLTTNVVGWGIQPKPKIDGEVLGMSDEACNEWERTAMREFRLWAENNFCDGERSKNFYVMQELAFRSMLMSGDVFVLFGNKANGRTPYTTTLRLIEADRVSTPDSSGESAIVETESGTRIIDGVEIDREGAVVKYHIANRHPLAEENSTELEWVAIDAVGKKTGYPNILHIFDQERPEQRRGIPFVASQMELIKQFDRYLKAELSANLVSALLAAFIETGEEDEPFPIDDGVDPDEKVTDSELNIELGPGAVIQLPPGMHMKEFNPLRNNTAFENVTNTYETLIGAGEEIPREVMLKKYDSNYTAARSALLDFWRYVRVRRSKFNWQFNQPIYEQWLTEAVALGRIDAPGFFDDPVIRQAWCGCEWMGATLGHVDPLKEVKAARERIAANISTEEQEAAEYNGNNWTSNIRQRKKELSALEEAAVGAEKGGGVNAQ